MLITLFRDPGFDPRWLFSRHPIGQSVWMVACRAVAIEALPALMVALWSLSWHCSSFFGFGHIVFHNWIAVVFSFVGGLFACTYRQTRSLFLTWLEHAIIGNAIFTVWLGVYFQHVIR